MPFKRKQPPVSKIPLAKVEVAVVEPTLSVETESPPAKVEVAFVEVAKYAVAVGVEVPTILVPLNERIEELESEEAFVPPCAMERVPEKSVSVTDAQVATPAPLSERTNWLVHEVPVNDCTPPVPFPTRSVEESVEEPVPPFETGSMPVT